MGEALGIVSKYSKKNAITIATKMASRNLRKIGPKIGGGNSDGVAAGAAAVLSTLHHRAGPLLIWAPKPEVPSDQLIPA